VKGGNDTQSGLESDGAKDSVYTGGEIAVAVKGEEGVPEHTLKEEGQLVACGRDIEEKLRYAGRGLEVFARSKKKKRKGLEAKGRLKEMLDNDMPRPGGGKKAVEKKKAAAFWAAGGEIS